MKDNLDWVHHDSKTFDNERFMEEVMGRYVEKNTTHIKGYTKEFVDKLIEEKDKEIERLNNIINECAEEILKELQENHHLSYGVALAIRQKLINYRELKESGNNE